MILALNITKLILIKGEQTNFLRSRVLTISKHLQDWKASKKFGSVSQLKSMQDLRKNELRYGALSDVCPLGRERSEWVPYPVNFA
ncbi:MAG: hypothetical protein A3B68_06050 [Candidatus Melainabacteria bacterium RIFCSPHIGHO2_02_FULL_34_12]|nr:MAG: hypothetical protein A3B68_06050 [Candidatus Melainabacteria bacterium RIFCSPHIGHO2_02_FULL_34_12]